MALMTLGLGAEVDIATGDELSAMGDDLTKKILGSAPALPIVFTRPVSVAGRGGIATLIVGSPPVGRLWEVSAVTVMGNSPFGASPHRPDSWHCTRGTQPRRAWHLFL